MVGVNATTAEIVERLRSEIIEDPVEAETRGLRILALLERQHLVERLRPSDSSLSDNHVRGETIGFSGLVATKPLKRTPS
jgi:hypothetical protein